MECLFEFYFAVHEEMQNRHFVAQHPIHEDRRYLDDKPILERMHNRYFKGNFSRERLCMKENNKSRLTTPLLAKRSRANKPFSTTSSIHAALNF